MSHTQYTEQEGRGEFACAFGVEQVERSLSQLCRHARLTRNRHTRYSGQRLWLRLDSIGFCLRPLSV